MILHRLVCYMLVDVSYEFAYSIVVNLMMETVSSSQTSVNTFHTTRRNISEDSHLHTCRCGNPKPHVVSVIISQFTVIPTQDPIRVQHGS
jgi:hypothetical protein